MAEPGGVNDPPAVIHCRREHLESIRAIYNREILHTTALYEYEPRSAETMAAWWAAKQTAGLPVLGVESEPGVLAGFATWGPFRSFPAYLHTAEHRRPRAARAHRRDRRRECREHRAAQSAWIHALRQSSRGRLQVWPVARSRLLAADLHAGGSTRGSSKPLR